MIEVKSLNVKKLKIMVNAVPFTYTSAQRK